MDCAKRKGDGVHTGVLRVSRGQQRISEVGGAMGLGMRCWGVGFFFPSGFCFTFLTLHSLKTVFEVPQSQRANLVSHHGMLVNLLLLLTASLSYSAQSGTRHRQQGGVSLIVEAKKGAW